MLVRRHPAVSILAAAAVLAVGLVAPSLHVATAQEAPPGWAPAGDLFAWGADDHGQLGDGEGAPETCSDLPCALEPVAAGLGNVVMVDGGNTHAIALTADGVIHNWGGEGRLPDSEGALTSSDTPVPFEDLPPIIAVAAGGDHSLAVEADTGGVWAWGLDNGQLGHGGAIVEDTFVTEPRRVVQPGIEFPFPLEGIVAVDGGAQFSMALRGTDGSVWTWGSNDRGQLGNPLHEGGSGVAVPVLVGVDPESGSPILLSDVAEIVAIAAGSRHGLALDSGGFVWAWGDNEFGQLGLGDSSDPVVSVARVVDLGDVVQVAAGHQHSLLLQHSFGDTGDRVSIYSMGRNHAGQLGEDTDGASRGFPEPIAFGDGDLTDFTIHRVDADGDYSVALVDDASVWTWGDNTFGQLGRGGSLLQSDATPGRIVETPSPQFGIGTGILTAYSIGEPLDVGSGIANLSLTVDPPNGPIGVPDIDLAEVDLGTLPLFPGDLESAPLRASPLRASPLRASPLRASPLRASPLRASPLRASPLRASPLRASPLRASSLPPMLLSDVPLLREGGWPQFLAEPPTPYAGLPTQSVTLQQVLALDPVAFPQVDGLTLEDIDITSTPLRASSIQTFLFAGPSLDDLSPTADWCGELAALGFNCAAAGITEATSTLVDVHFAGGPVDDLGFLPLLPVADADLAGSPAFHYDVASVNVGITHLGDVLVNDLPGGIVDCATFDCTATTTLGDAVAAGAIVDGPDAVLGRVLEFEDLAGGLTFGDVIRMLVDPAKLLFAEFPLTPLALGTPVDRNLITYTASADVACSEADEMGLLVEIPAGFRYAPGSTMFSFDGSGPEPIDDPILVAPLPDDGFPTDVLAPLPSSDRSILGWSLGGECGEVAGHLELSFQAQPWIVLGMQTAGVRLITAAGSDESISHTAPFAVDDAHEPNDTLVTSTQVRPGTLVLSHLGEGDPIDRFEVVNEDGSSLERGSLVTAVISHLPADFDLQMAGPSSAPLRASPLRASPLRASPLRASPIEDDGLPGDGSGLVLEPDRLQDLPEVDDGADLLSTSAHRGFETEIVSALVTADTAGEPLTLAVSGYLRASSDDPYTVQVFVEPPPELNCVPQTAFSGGGVNGVLPAVGDLDPGTRTLVLVNQQRLGAQYGQDAVDGILDALALLDGDEHAGPFAILPVDGAAGVRNAYAAWDADPCEPELANDIVREIVGVMDGYITELPDLRFAVVVGDDNIIPSYRVPDLATLANQRYYYPDLVFGQHDNPLSAAAGLGYVNTDGVYGDLDSIGWLGHELIVPELAVGRLVETPGEIIGAIEQYEQQPFIAIDTTTVTAYDFLLDGGQDIHDALVDVAAPTTTHTKINDTWNKSEVLGDGTLGSDVVALNAHFDHSRFLTAAGDAALSPTGEVASSTEALAAGLAEGMLFFTVGCNAGINVPALAAIGTSAAGTERLLDWAQTSQQLKGTLFANTGFGYGDTELNAYSEKLMTHFAGNLDGSMTIGQAAVAARHAYLGELGLPGVYDDKVITESTVYGLPFVRVGNGGGVAPRHDHLAQPVAETSALTFDTFSRIRATTFDFAIDYFSVSTSRGDYFQALDPVVAVDPDPEPLLISHYRPVQPQVSLHLPEAPDGVSIGDVLITGLTSFDEPLADPYFVRPTFDLEANEPEPNVVDVAFPASLGNVNPEGNLILHGGQFRSDPATPGSGTQVLYSRVAGEVLYPDDPASPPDRPTFTRVEATELHGSFSVAFLVEAAPAEMVLVMYRIPGQAEWGSLLLSEAAAGVWTGATTDQVEEYFVQAVNGGVVGSARGKGLNYQPQPGLDATGFDVELIQLAGAKGDNGWFHGNVRATVVTTDGTTGAVYEASLNGGPYVALTGDPAHLDIEETGLHVLSIRRSDGDRARVFVPIDRDNPVVELLFPTEGQVIGVGGELMAQVECSDVGSGIASCVIAGDLELNTNPGEHTLQLTVTATDVSGRQTVAHFNVTYHAQWDFEGFFPPVLNPPDVNVVKAGLTVPLKFRIRDGSGDIVPDLEVVESVTVTKVNCRTKKPEGPTEDITLGVELRFDEEAQQFIVNWQTDKQKRTCHQVTVITSDGVSHSALFQIR